jgi:predicted alpha/beta-fold hydrolase
MHHQPYQRPLWLFHAHLETIYPALLRKVEAPVYSRERINTPDDDFLDLDWVKNNHSQLVIISHGLEGNTERPYIKGMVRAFSTAGWDVLAWNYRGCSQEMNRTRRFYHCGATDDLDCVVQHALRSNYQRLVLVGFSLGGNLTLKYLGEATRTNAIEAAVAFSVPLNLHTSCQKISQPSNWLYSHRFLTSLKEKVIRKAAIRTDIDIQNIDAIKTLQSFDDRYTSQLHGYRDAVEYYTQCSSLRFVTNISIPTLIINAQNDPFLSKDCYPHTLLKNHPHVTFEAPAQGGHVGFAQFGVNGLFWSEARALDFVRHL